MPRADALSVARRLFPSTRLVSIIATVCSIAVITSSCDWNSETFQLMPLHVGNTWTYSVSEKMQQTGTEVYHVSRRISAYGTRFAEILIEQRDLDGAVVRRDTIYATSEAGLNLYREPDRGSLIAHFRHPNSAADSYQNPHGATICIAEASDLEVPAGRFQAIIYGNCQNFEADRTIFAPNVGMIFRGNFETRAIALSSYEKAP